MEEDPQEDFLKLKFRETARQLWREYPHLTFEEMVEQPDIVALIPQGEVRSQSQLIDLVSPELSSAEELPILKVSKIWSLGDAAAMWLDINPFVFNQAFQQRNPSFYTMPIFPGLRDRWFQLRDKASQAALLGELQTINDKDQHWIKPRDFYDWAISHAEEPSWSAEKVFAALNAQWEIEDAKNIQPEETKPPSKVELKRIEIKRIIESISAIDTEFDRLSMPGKREDFQNLCIQINKKMFSVAQETFNDYLVGLCTFSSGARETDYYSKIATKLG
jgi:hypothetical protein